MTHISPSRIEILLKRAQPGKNSGVKAHIKRGKRIALRIEEHWGVSEPYQFKAKHLQWFLKADTASLSSASRYDYWRTARVIASALGRWNNWEPHLRGTWTRPKPFGPQPGAPGGRPPKVAQPRSR